MPAFGLSGPYMTITDLRGHADDTKRAQMPSVIHMDTASGPVAAFAMLTALHYRDRMGEG